MSVTFYTTNHFWHHYRQKKESRGRVTQLFSRLKLLAMKKILSGSFGGRLGIRRAVAAAVLSYFLLKKFIVMAHPCVANERMASTKIFSRSGMAVRSSSVHSPRT